MRLAPVLLAGALALAGCGKSAKGHPMETIGERNYIRPPSDFTGRLERCLHGLEA